ncbi:TonB-dependent receptor [Aestuariibacter sp. AA17]|uniref:TonB-dependent receptor n=2 Tax=Fluctibacter corallii TaxID=2984329 RepID=A0ABT3A5W7_9ALTE|nr:TonB-dependent receptor [Aestuariibacter sp. AA17]
MTVPITVGTVTADTLEASSSILLSDIEKFIPGFEFDDSNMTQAGITMRGISSPNISVGGDPSSALFYDDIYMPRAAQNVLFSDIERIEVLKGPQGTLFGRNAALGVVHIIPKAPVSDTEGFLKVTLGTDYLFRLEGMANVALSEHVNMRVNALSNQQDGIVKNNARPTWNDGAKVWDLGARDHQALRVAFAGEVNSDTQWQLSVDIEDLEQAPPMAVGTSEFAYNGGIDPFADYAENDVREGVESREMVGVIAKLTHDFSEVWAAKWVVGYREWETVNREDEDGTANLSRYFDTSNNEDSDITYTELQFNYTGERLNLVFGGSYTSENVSQQTELNMTTDTVARLVTQNLNGQIQANIADELAAQLGGRSDAAAAAVFGDGVTFDQAVAMQFSQMGLPLDHIWQPEQWAGALTALGFANDIMAGIGFPGLPLTADVVTATGDITYDIVAQALQEPAIFGPSYSGQFWQENVFNTGDFTNWGVYVDAEWQLTDKWTVITGLRYSKDDKSFTWRIPPTTFRAQREGVTNLLFPEVQTQAQNTWSKTTGRLVSRYQFSADHMVFASYSTGYKAGGFDSLVPVTDSSSLGAFEPEDAKNIELGYKGVFNRTLIANMSLYRTELDNFQISIESKGPQNAQAIPTIINENREIKGVELDLRWQINDSLVAGIVTEIRETEIETPNFYNALGELIPARTRDFDAATNYTFTLDWMPDTRLGLMTVHLDYEFVENIQDQAPDIEAFKLAVPAYFDDRQLLNGRIALSDDTETWHIALWIKNALDERYVESLGGRTAQTLGTPFAKINRGRELGVDVKYTF